MPEYNDPQTAGREIIAMLHARREDALQAIRDQWGTLCLTLAYRILGSREDAEECFDDALLAVWQSIPPQTPQCLEAYLVTLVRRNALDRIKAAERQKRGGRQFAQALDELAEAIPDGTDIISQAEQNELNRALRAFLGTLSAEARQIMIQRYYFAQPVKAIAKAHDMQTGAVKMLLHRTRKKLKTYLQEEGFL